MTGKRSRARRAAGHVRDRLARHVLLPVQQFIRTEASGGAVLLAAALAALVWANFPAGDSYADFWDTGITIDGGIFRISEDLQHWVDDALMAIFFFVVGLEVKRELLHGELAGPRRAALPVAAALGGMAVPALLFTALNAGGDGARGWGIPVATDIAFSLGVLALLGKRIPTQVRVFLLALAVVDDIGAILVIAAFYTESIAWDSLAVAALIAGAIFVLQRLGVSSIPVYLIAGAALWVAVFESGIHATIAGVALGLLTPSRPRVSPGEFAESEAALYRQFRAAISKVDEEEAEAVLAEIESEAAATESPLDRLERILHPWSSFLIVPIFALANSGIDLSADAVSDAAGSPITLGVMLGLVLGKFAGVVGAAWLAVRLRLTHLPSDIGWPHVAGIGLLAGIGFTVSLFVAGLAYDDPALAADAKMGIFAASLVAGLAGYTYLRLATGRVDAVQAEV